MTVAVETAAAGDAAEPESAPAVLALGDRHGLALHVQAYVRVTAGFEPIGQRGFDHALALLAPPKRHFRIDIHVTCGGRRSVVVAEELAAWLQAASIGAETEDGHVNRPVLT
ncbi:hypothetical protein ACN24M_01585 [Streptomyces microflavus]|uniref:hypothetical protein n=1 Tax=Streptomyces TaxID=1883 RepID=UPI00397F2DC9